MTYTYNLNRHLQLLKYSKILLSQGKSLLKEAPAEYKELLTYAAEIEIFWTGQTFLTFIMEKFIDKNVNRETFTDLFLTFLNTLEYVYQFHKPRVLESKGLKENFQPRYPSSASALPLWIGNVRSKCDLSTDDYKDENFYNSMKDYLLELQQILNKE